MEIDWETERKDARAELAALQRQEDRRNAEPLLLCKLIVRWPLRSFLLTLFGHIAMIAVTGVLYASGYDIMPLFLEDIPMRLVDEPWDARWFAWLDRNKFNNHYTRGGIGSGFRTSEQYYSTLDLYYENNKGTNVFTREHLLKVKEFEDALMRMERYDQYCKLDAQTKTCDKPKSILRYFDGTYSFINPIFNDPNLENIQAVLYEAYTNNSTRDAFQFFLATSFKVIDTEVTSPLTRSLLWFGRPHEEFDATDYRAESEKYSGEVVKPILDRYEKNGDFRMSYRSEALWMYVAREQAMSDVLWAGASMAFIFIVVIIHTRSLWIAGLAIFSVFASFFTGNLIYNLVLRFQYIGYFHILALFIILGIGADNFFVFYDIWRNTGCDNYPSLAHRLSDSYKRSVFSMLFTSLTTAVAFFCSAITPLLGTRSFGVFSGVVVLVNYLSVILYFPTVVIMYHIYFEKSTWPCCYPCLNKSEKENTFTEDNKVDDTPVSQESEPYESRGREIEDDMYLGGINPVYESDKSEDWSSYHQSPVMVGRGTKLYSSGGRLYRKHGDFIYTHSMSNDHTFRGNSNMANGYTQTNSYLHDDLATPRQSRSSEKTKVNTKSKSSKPPRKPKKKSLFVRFFRNYYFRFVTNRYTRWLIILVLLGVLAFLIYQGSMIEPDNELFNILPEDHPMMLAYRYKLYGFLTTFGQGNALLSVHLLFGVKENDISTCHFSDPVCSGKQAWDPSFNPNTLEAQTALLELCETLRTVSAETADRLHIQKHPITGKYNIKCFMDNLQAFLQEESQLTGANWSLPFSKEKAADFAAARPQFFNTSIVNLNFTNTLEIPISYWLTNRYTNEYTSDFYTYDSLIGEEIGIFSSSVNSNPDILYGNNIKFVAVSIGTTIQAMLLGYTNGEPIMEAWEDFMKQQLAKMPEELKTGFQISSHQRWVWLTRQRLLVENAIYGIAIGLSLALIILIIATGNVITGALATLSLCCCTACVLGVIVLGGWKLGLIEAVNMCMVVGLSVDYVVHLAEGYTLSLHHDRLSRVRDMLDLMGVSIFFGAFTTLGASVFMFFTVLSFFSQFGTFLFSTIGFSLLFSMGLFTTLLGIIGPEGDTGNVVAMVKRLCCRKDRRQHK